MRNLSAKNHSGAEEARRGQAEASEGACGSVEGGGRVYSERRTQLAEGKQENKEEVTRQEGKRTRRGEKTKKKQKRWKKKTTEKIIEPVTQDKCTVK